MPRGRKKKIIIIIKLKIFGSFNASKNKDVECNTDKRKAIYIAPNIGRTVRENIFFDRLIKITQQLKGLFSMPSELNLNIFKYNIVQYSQ